MYYAAVAMFMLLPLGVGVLTGLLVATFLWIAANRRRSSASGV